MSASDRPPQRSERPAKPPPKRVERPNPILAGATMLVTFAFMMGVVLAVVFPTGREYAEVTSKQRVDAYSIAYLHVLTRANPKDGNLRFVYVSQLAQLGRWEEALEILETTPKDAQGGGDVRKLRLELMIARANSLPEDSPERAKAFATIHDELSEMVDATPVDQLETFAKLALQLEDPALGARFYIALATKNPVVRVDALEQAGKWLRASGDGEGGANAYRRASELATDPEQKTRLLLLAVDALEAMSGACPAADLIAPLAEASTDKAVIERATRIMMSCGRAVEAKLLGRRLLAFAPDDEAEQKAQIRRELAGADPAGALVLLRALVTKYPSDGDIREATAKVAEWAGQPAIALEQWLWLLDVGRVPSGTLKLPE